MRFWDSSAVVPLIVRQRLSDRLAQLFQDDPELRDGLRVLASTPQI